MKCMPFYDGILIYIFLNANPVSNFCRYFVYIFHLTKLSTSSLNRLLIYIRYSENPLELPGPSEIVGLRQSD